MPTKMKFLFGRKTTTKVTCAYITELSYGSVADIFSPTQMTFFGTKTKNKTQLKKHFRPKTEKRKRVSIAGQSLCQGAGRPYASRTKFVTKPVPKLFV